MKKLLVAASFAAVVAFAGANAWQANAAMPAAPVPVAGLYTPIHPAACGGPGRYCGPHHHYVGRKAGGAGARAAEQDVKALAFRMRLV